MKLAPHLLSVLPRSVLTRNACLILMSLVISALVNLSVLHASPLMNVTKASAGLENVLTDLMSL